MKALPLQFVKTIQGVHGQAGATWIAALDKRIAFCETKWGFVVQEPFSLSYNFVAPVEWKDGRKAVLKLAVPSQATDIEFAAMMAFQGKGVCDVLYTDKQKGILVMEYIQPGISLRDLENEEDSIRVVAELVQRMHTHPDTDLEKFPAIADWAQGLNKLRTHFDGGSGPLPEHLVIRAEQLYPKLCAGIGHPRLLHGDLHHENILQTGQNQWIAIDPKGLVGETEYELIPFLINNLPEDNPTPIIQNRVRRLAQILNLDENRILSWAFCHAVLSAWWCVEDNAGCEQSAIRTAIVLAALVEQ